MLDTLNRSASNLETLASKAPPPKKAVILACQALYFRFPNAALWNLENVSFSLVQGDFLVLLGPNGGGKTTLIKLLLGILTPEKGALTIFQTSPKNALPKIGYVPQYFSGENHLLVSVLDVVKMGVKQEGLWPRYFSKQERQQSYAALEKVGMAHLAKSLFRTLSGGERQKVLLARAIVSEPELLILDEPTNHVDIDGKRELCSLMNELAKSTTLIMVSHDLSAIPEGVTKIGCVDRSLVIHQDFAKDQYQSPHEKNCAFCFVDFVKQSQLKGEPFYRSFLGFR